MLRMVMVYGLIAGVILELSLALVMASGVHGGVAGMVFGYLSMLVALSLVFVGVRRYRDEMLGGVIGFWPALGTGLAISAVASACYVIGWEIYMALTGNAFIAHYAASALEAKRAAGASAAELARTRAELDHFAQIYAQPLLRMAITLSEIAPVGLLVPLISAALLRNRNFLPARAEV